MRGLVRYSFTSAAVAAFLVACAASPQSTFAPAKASEPMTAAYARSLLYVTAGTEVQVFAFPHGRPVGSLGVFGFELCSDNSGNIIASGAEGIGYVWVFPHGKSSPIATLYNPGAPGGCSVDPGTEKIAVANPDGSPISVFPYKNGWKLAHQYSDADLRSSLYCAYDLDGNLFADGYASTDSFVLVELLKATSNFQTITLDQTIHSPGSLQWVGGDLAVEDAGISRTSSAVIYTFSISSGSGHTVSATTLKSSASRGQFLIHGNVVIGPLSAGGIGIWRFPSGGKPTHIISTYGSATGEALSLK